MNDESNLAQELLSLVRQSGVSAASPEFPFESKRLTQGSSGKQFVRVWHREHTFVLGWIPTTGPCSDEHFSPANNLPLTPAEAFIDIASTLHDMVGGCPRLLAVKENIFLFKNYRVFGKKWLKTVIIN